MVHPSEVERQSAHQPHHGLTTGSPAAHKEGSSGRGRDGLVIADTREQVTAPQRRDPRPPPHHRRRLADGRTVVTTAAGERLGVGDRIATRRNDRDLGVANRDCWTVTGVDADGSPHVRGRGGDRTLPADYVRDHVELAYATTAHGAQGETVHAAHLLVGESTGAAARTSA